MITSKRGSDESIQKYKNEVLPKLEEWVKTRTNSGAYFLSGTEHPDIIDICLFPHLEKVVAFEGTSWSFVFDKLNVKVDAPNLYAYVHKFRSLD
jgi:hypothetical protein